MSITPIQAKLILSQAQPLILGEEANRPVTQIHVCLTPDVLSRLGIVEAQLHGHGGGLYDGMDYLKDRTRVHVFDKRELGKLAAMTWIEYEIIRRAEMTEKGKA